MSKMCESGRTCLITSAGLSPCSTSCWTNGPATRPVLPQFLGELLASSRPIVANTVAEFHYMALQFKLVFLKPGEIKLLA